MNTKKKLLTTSAMTFLAIATPVVSKVYAQSKNFSGPYISAGAGVMENEYSTSLNSPATLPTAGTYSSSTATTQFVGFNNAATTIFQRAAQTLSGKEQNTVGTISLGYNYAIDNNFLIGIDLSGRTGTGSKSFSSSYNISTLTGGTQSATEGSVAITTTTGTQSLKVEDKSAYALSIKPTVVVNNNLAVYGKLGYGITTLEATLTTADSVSSHSKKEDVEGHTFGIGAVYLINNNTFIDFGVDYTKNKDLNMSKNDSSVTPTLTSFSLNTTTHTLSETVDSSSYGAFIRVGMKF
jgi:hypothetical protein